MHPRPPHLTAENAAAFQARSVAERYHLRTPYPAALFEILEGLIGGVPRVVLDVGAGPGSLARPLAARVDRVDAVEPSREMIALGQAEPGGAAANLHWIEGTAEEAALHPPYGLVTAGESLHWMAWERVLPRFASVLHPGGLLAITRRDQETPPWNDELSGLLREYSTIRDYQEFRLVEELQARGLYEHVGEQATEPHPYAQSVEDYIASFHSMSSFSLDRMAPAATAFDEKLRALVAPYAVDGRITLQVFAHVEWGRPLPQ